MRAGSSRGRQHYLSMGPASRSCRTFSLLPPVAVLVADSVVSNLWRAALSRTLRRMDIMPVSMCIRARKIPRSHSTFQSQLCAPTTTRAPRLTMRTHNTFLRRHGAANRQRPSLHGAGAARDRRARGRENRQAVAPALLRLAGHAANNRDTFGVPGLQRWR